MIGEKIDIGVGVVVARKRVSPEKIPRARADMPVFVVVVIHAARDAVQLANKEPKH